MDPTRRRNLARLTAEALASMRCAIGVIATARPTIAATPWVGATESRRVSIQILGRALGGRDLALGLGALTADSDAGLARIAALGAVADGVDFLATLKDFKQLPRIGRLLVLGSTLGAFSIGLLSAMVLNGPEEAPITPAAS